VPISAFFYKYQRRHCDTDIKKLSRFIDFAVKNRRFIKRSKTEFLKNAQNDKIENVADE
jgi:hypothetical protein